MMSIQLHHPISAEPMSGGGKTWVRLGFANGKPVDLYLFTRDQAGAIADAINSENEARLDPSADVPVTPANDDEHAFVSIGNVAAGIIGRLQKGGRP